MEPNERIKYLEDRLRSEKHIYADHIASLITENERIHNTFQGELADKLNELTKQVEILTKRRLINKLKRLIKPKK